MMIEINGFTKKYGNRYIYNDVSFSLPNSGVVALVGESGSGKTTLLNAIAGLDFDYEGEILINKTNLKNLKKNTLSDYRIHKIGYVFQNFKLLNLESVEANISLPFDSTCNYPREVRKRKVEDVCALLGITDLLKKNVNKLSGGQKQRVAIARAMINNPKVILCDEPTGALDENNSEQIYSILRKISSNSLIIIASHDVGGVKTIANQIITLKDGKVCLEENKYHYCSSDLVLAENKLQTAKGSLPLSFKIRHSFRKMKSKKFRSLITNLMLSLSLTGIGLSILISSNVSNKINNAFSYLVNGNQIVMSLKQESQNTFNKSYSAPINYVNNIYNKYQYFLDGIGVNYLVNYEDFFKDNNSVYIEGNYHKVFLPSLSARSINDFHWLDEDKTFYPNNITELDDDEVCLGLTYADMVNLCFNLQIQRNYESLGSFINEHGLFMTMEVENTSWEYADEQIFEIRAVTESNKTSLYHTNKLWNEYVFEKAMLIPSDDDEEHSYPWEMSKIYYLQTLDEPTSFLDTIIFDEDFSDFVFERINYQYNPILCEPDSVCEEKRLFVYLIDKNAINPSHIQYISKLDSNIKNYYFNSDFGYSSFSSNIMSGFSKNIFVSLDKDKLVYAVDADNELDSQSNFSLDLPSDVVHGNFLNGIQDGVRFSTKIDNLIAGRKPLNNNEIVISKGLAKRIDPNELGIGKYLNIAGEINEYVLENKQINKEYGFTKAVIVGIVDEERNYLYHDNLWTISFFRDKLGISSFRLIPKSVVIELDSDVDASKIIKKLNKMFHEYNFASPSEELSSSVDSTLEYANVILIGFSILSTFISILLLGTVVLLNILESKEEVSLLNVLGIKHRDISSMFVVQSLIQGFLAFVVSAIEIVVVDIVISKALGDTLSVNLGYSINFIPVLIVFVISIVLPIITSFVVIKFLFKNKTNFIDKRRSNC